MKSRVCPYRQHCRDSGDCETCDFGKAFEKQLKKIKSLKEKNRVLRSENEELEKKIEILKNPNF